METARIGICIARGIVIIIVACSTDAEETAQSVPSKFIAELTMKQRLEKTLEHSCYLPVRAAMYCLGSE